MIEAPLAPLPADNPGAEIGQDAPRHAGGEHERILG